MCNLQRFFFLVVFFSGVNCHLPEHISGSFRRIGAVVGGSFLTTCVAFHRAAALRLQVAAPLAVITVTFTTWSFCAGVAASKLQLPPPPPLHHPNRHGGGEGSDKPCAGQFLAA